MHAIYFPLDGATTNLGSEEPFFYLVKLKGKGWATLWFQIGWNVAQNYDEKIRKM